MKRDTILKLNSEGKTPEEIAALVNSSIQCVRTVISQFKDIKQQPVVVTEIKTAVKKAEIDQKSLIPTEDKTYIARKLSCGITDVKLIQNLYDKRYSRQNPRFILLIGETGCGKTVLASNHAAKNKIPYMRLNLNGATTPEDLVGQYIQAENNTFQWRDGWLTTFMRHGGLLVLDEINMCPADILSILHSVTDKEKRLVLTQKDGEVINAHENFWIIATMNPDYEGTKPLNIALKDRFVEISIPYSAVVEKKLGIAEKFLEVVEKLRKSESIIRPISTRDLINYRDDSADFGEEVAQFFFINRFEPQEQRVVAEMIDLIMNGKQPPKEEAKQEETTQ